MVLGNSPQEPVFYIGETAIEIKCYLKILGVHINNKPSFKDHLSTFDIESLSQKIINKVYTKIILKN